MLKNKKEKLQKPTSGDSVDQPGKFVVEKVNNEKVTNNNNVSSKKRKMESDKISKKKIKTKHQEQNTEGDNSLTYRVIFPLGVKCYKDVVQKVINSSDTVLRPGMFTIKFASAEEAKQKSAELRKINVGNSKLIVNSPQSIKRIIFLQQNFKDLEQLKKFYGALAVEQALSAKGNLSHKFELTFGSETKAIAASKKSYTIGNKSYTLETNNSKGPTKEIKQKEAQNVSNAKNQNKGKQIVHQQKKTEGKMQKKQTENRSKQVKRKKPDPENDDDDDDDEEDE